MSLKFEVGFQLFKLLFTEVSHGKKELSCYGYIYSLEQFNEDIFPDIENFTVTIGKVKFHQKFIYIQQIYFGEYLYLKTDSFS